MNYVEKNYEEIFEAALDDSISNGLISHANDFKSFIANREDISNVYVVDKSVISYMVRRVYEAMTLVYNSVDLDLATGIDLDNIGKKLGIPRPLDTKASVKVKFTLDRYYENNISIPEGVIVSADNGVTYETIEELFISSDNISATITCLSVDAGSHVRVSANSLNNIVSNLGYNLTCTNPTASNGGEDKYNDDDYRDLLLKHREILITGSTKAYENYFANVDGVNDYRLIPNWDVAGTMKIVVDPGDSALLNQIYADLQDMVSLAKEDIVLFAPNEKEIDISVVVNVNIDQINPYSELEKEDIKSKISSAIKVFVEEMLGIGEDFIPHKLAVFLDDEIPEVKNIQFNYPADYVEIADDEICVCNNISIEMI